MTRLERAKEMFNARVSKAEPSFENPLWQIKQDILGEIHEFIFDDNPLKEEMDWLKSELEEISVYSNTEWFSGNLLP